MSLQWLINAMEPLHLCGRRLDILGHDVKAIGVLRVLADPDAEGQVG